MPLHLSQNHRPFTLISYQYFTGWSILQRNERISLSPQWYKAHLPIPLLTQLLARPRPATLLVMPCTLYATLTLSQITIISCPEPIKKIPITRKVSEM